MTEGTPYILREKRQYNKWVMSQTLEDFALRYTAAEGRRWSAWRVAQTAIGATAFLACEAIGAAITLAYGFANSVAAIAAAVVVMFLIGLPIAWHAARNGLDIDLLTRGAGFGYLGSTVTSLVYASFTFLLFSVEASIMAVALRAMTGMPMSIAYILCSIVVIPIAIYGMSAITRFQVFTQPIWIVLQLAPIVYILTLGQPVLAEWRDFTGIEGAAGGGVDLILFGLAFSTLLSLLPQIGEQADYLRFMPAAKQIGQRKWAAMVIAAGPGWSIIGGIKLLLGSFLAAWVIARVPEAKPDSPTDMFDAIFTAMVGHDGLALVLTGLFVIVCQLKINVTNAYAGSIAWSNFFSRLTHSHPGRVVWLVFNVMLALILIEIGIINAIEQILILYANVAVAWIGALAADLVVSKPLGLSPPEVEFKRAHLYDINPVGIGAMAISIIVSGSAQIGLLGDVAHAFAPAIGLCVAFVAAPAIALATRSRYYLARRPLSATHGSTTRQCIICEHQFEAPDMADCPMYRAPICSLCCTLEARCHDRCKQDSRATQQIARWASHALPAALARHVHTPVAHFIGVMAIILVANAAVLMFIHAQFTQRLSNLQTDISTVLLGVYIVFSLLGGVAAWIIVLAHQSRRAAVADTNRHMDRLIEEIAAHDATDAELQRAKEAAEAANAAKSRYLVSVSHEIRSPLNSIYGYAQLIERGSDVVPGEAAKVIRRSAEHLTNLVEGLLDISQVESGILRVNSDVLRLPVFLEQIVSMVQYQATSKGLTFSFDRPDKLPDFVRTDQKRLRQILINILTNAIKFTQDGEVRLRVRYRSQLATFEISDTGVGIAQDDLKRIFDPFDRGTNPEAQRQQGVGLGLSITQALVQILGGEISVASQPGRGTTFTVRLMMGNVTAPVTETGPVEAVTGYDGVQRSILIVDDDPHQIAMLRALLDPLGFAIRAATSGEQAIALCEEALPDLVIMDITMPGLSGWETAARLRTRSKDGETMQPRIIMLSADAHEFRPGDTSSETHDVFLAKPVELNLLLDTLAGQLGIIWRSKDAPATPKSSRTQKAPVAPLPESVRPYLDEIGRLARIGYVRGIEAQIAQMISIAPESEDLGHHMLMLLDRFDLKSLGRLVKEQSA